MRKRVLAAQGYLPQETAASAAAPPPTDSTNSHRPLLLLPPPPLLLLLMLLLLSCDGGWHSKATYLREQQHRPQLHLWVLRCRQHALLDLT
jgi:hypothetical protein